LLSLSRTECSTKSAKCETPRTPTNSSNLTALGAIALEAKENLKVETFTVLVDKDYHNGREIAQCKENNITTVVVHPMPRRSKVSVAQPHYLVAQFKYNKSGDPYKCLQGATLKLQGRGIKKAVEPKKTLVSSRNTKHPLAKTVS
jgi:hypothetical protein